MRKNGPPVTECHVESHGKLMAIKDYLDSLLECLSTCHDACRCNYPSAEGLGYGPIDTRRAPQIICNDYQKLFVENGRILFHWGLIASLRLAMNEKNSLPSLMRRLNSSLSRSISPRILRIG